jgi:hypothetical protein
VITDKFGCRLEVGDWVLYVPIDTSGATLKYGQIGSFGKVLDSSMFVNIKDSEEFTKPGRCVKFSQEEYTMRKLESEA